MAEQACRWSDSELRDEITLHGKKKNQPESELRVLRELPGQIGRFCIFRYIVLRDFE